MLLEQQDICVKEININSYFTPYLKFSSKCIIDQNIKAKTGKFKWKQKIQSWNERFFNTLKMSSEQNLLKTLYMKKQATIGSKHLQNNSEQKNFVQNIWKTCATREFLEKRSKQTLHKRRYRWMANKHLRRS